MRFVTHYKNINIAEWERFIQQFSQINFFHTPSMVEAFVLEYGEKKVCFTALINEHEELVGLCIGYIYSEKGAVLNLLSSRCVVWGGPLLLDHTHIDLLLSAFNKVVGNKAIYTQIRNLNDISSSDRCFKKAGYHFEEHLDLLNSLSLTEDELWKLVFSKRRNQIKKGIKEGVIVKEINEENDLISSYKVIKEVYDRARLPLPSITYFQKCFKKMIPAGTLRVFAAMYNQQVIGTMFILTSSDAAYDWYAGSLKEFYSKQPNDVLPWLVFLNLKAKGYTLFDFGGAGKPNVPYPVRDYKMQYGGQLVCFGRYQKVNNKLLYFIGKTGFAFWQYVKSKKTTA